LRWIDSEEDGGGRTQSVRPPVCAALRSNQIELETVRRRRAKPATPAAPLKNNHAAAGSGTGVVSTNPSNSDTDTLPDKMTDSAVPPKLAAENADHVQ